MAKVILKNSSVALKVPLVTDLVFGEVALNYQDGKLYYKKADGTTIGSFIDAGGVTYVGTTSISLSRASAQQTLTGVSIDGSAGSLTNALTIGTGLTGTSYNGSSAVTIAITNPVPTQTGNSGKYLTTDGSALSWATVAGSGTVTSIIAGTGLSGGTITTAGTIALANTAVTAGSYTSANITVDAQGRITAAASGSGGSGGSSSAVTRNYTGTGSQTAFTVTTGFTVDTVLVIQNGVVQTPTTDYTITGTTLTFITAPELNDTIQIRELGSSGSGSGSGTYTRTSYTATAGQTLFNVTYTVGNLQVYINGILLATSDYTATSGTSFTLGVGATTGDIVEAIVVISQVTGTTTGKSIAMALIFGS